MAISAVGPLPDDGQSDGQAGSFGGYSRACRSCRMPRAAIGVACRLPSGAVQGESAEPLCQGGASPRGRAASERYDGALAPRPEWPSSGKHYRSSVIPLSPAALPRPAPPLWASFLSPPALTSPLPPAPGRRCHFGSVAMGPPLFGPRPAGRCRLAPRERRVGDPRRRTCKRTPAGCEFRARCSGAFVISVSSSRRKRRASCPPAIGDRAGCAAAFMRLAR